MTGNGEAFDELDGEQSRQITVVQAEGGYVYITIVVDRKALKFFATDDQARAIAKALTKATKR